MTNVEGDRTLYMKGPVPFTAPLAISGAARLRKIPALHSPPFLTVLMNIYIFSVFFCIDKSRRRHYTPIGNGALAARRFSEALRCCPILLIHCHPSPIRALPWVHMSHAPPGGIWDIVGHLGHFLS